MNSFLQHLVSFIGLVSFFGGIHFLYKSRLIPVKLRTEDDNKEAQRRADHVRKNTKIGNYLCAAGIAVLFIVNTTDTVVKISDYLDRVAAIQER